MIRNVLYILYEIYTLIKIFCIYTYIRLLCIFNLTDLTNIHIKKLVNINQFQKISTQIGTTKPIILYIHKNSTYHKNISEIISKKDQKKYNSMCAIRDEPKIFYSIEIDLNIDDIVLFVNQDDTVEWGMLNENFDLLESTNIIFIDCQSGNEIKINPNRKTFYTQLICFS